MLQFCPPYGIVDNPYTYIGSIGGNTDYLPIAEDGAPTIIIHSPDPGHIFCSTSPSFNVKITDDYLDEMWYTIDGGLNNFTFTDNGTIDESAWNAIPEGNITLTFYASDIPGNLGTTEVIIKKNIPSKGVIGLDYFMTSSLLILIGGMAVIIVIARMKSKRKLISE